MAEQIVAGFLVLYLIAAPLIGALALRRYWKRLAAGEQDR